MSTTTIKVSFSAMKIVKNKFRNKMEDGYPVDAQITFI
jgi:hypothetical protein